MTPISRTWRLAPWRRASTLIAAPPLKKFATIYDLQQQFNRLQDRLLEAWIPMLTPAQDGDPEKLDDRALRDWRQQVLTSLSHLQAEVNFGKSLSAEYAKVLEQP